jgi:hypothetical protein
MSEADVLTEGLSKSFSAQAPVTQLNPAAAFPLAAQYLLKRAEV